METDHAVLASRAVEPFFYFAPEPPQEDRKLALYQHAAVEYCIARNHALIGDAPGVGKSAEAVAISNAIGAKRTAVICPSSLVLNWQREVWMWSTIPNVTTYPIRASRDGLSHDHHFVILSYDMIKNPSILHAFLEQRWDHVILDEAHALKDPRGNQRTRIICAPDLIPSVTGRFTLLSGTIMPNQPKEVYNAIRLCNWDAIDRASLEDFTDKYYDVGEGWTFGRVWDEQKQAFKYARHWSDRVRNVPVNLDDLQYRLRKHVMVRRLKAQVLHELPDKRWHLLPLAINAAMRQALKHPGWRIAEQIHEMDDTAFDHGAPIEGPVAEARRLLGEATAPAVCDYIEELLEEGVDKLLVGAWHHSVLGYMRERLAPLGLVYMDGRTSTSAKQRAVDDFQNNPDVRIILGQEQVIGTGWTLHAAQDAVLAEFDWVPGNNDQFLDRLHRKGQRGSVTGHVPIVPGTLHERMWGVTVRKGKHIHAALDA